MTKTVAGNTTQFFYDEQGHLTGEYDASGQLIQEIIWLGDLPVAALKPSTSATTPDIYYIHADHLGTPRKITRPLDNKVMWTWESEAFGNGLSDQNPVGLGNFVFNLRFPGQYYDQETGLHYNMERYYNSDTGRYDQSDRIGLAGGINTYTYVGNNPLNFVDPLGLIANPAEAACAAGPNPVCAAGVVVDIATTIISGAMIADSLSEKAEKSRENKEYNRICKTAITPTGDQCTDAKANLSRLKQCLQLREEFGRKWYNDADPGHETKNQETRKAISNLEEWIRHHCGEQCE